MDWRDTLQEQFILRAVDRGIKVWDEDQVLELFTDIADSERGKPEKDRIGCAYAIDNWKPNTMVSFMKKLKLAWDSISSRPVRIQSVLPPSSTHSMMCTLSMKLNKKLTKEQIKEQFHSFLVAETGFECNVEDVCHIVDDWWDLLITYSIHLNSIYEKVFEQDLVSDLVTKPSADFGKKTLANVR